MKYKPNWDAQAQTPGAFNQLTSGRHVVMVESAVIEPASKKTGAFSVLNGKAELRLRVKVRKGVSTGCRINVDAMLEGQFVSKKGNLVDAHYTAASILRAINPTFNAQEFDTEDLIGKIFEIDIEVRVGSDGRVSMWPGRINGAYPYVSSGTVESPEKPLYSDDDDIAL